MGASSNPVGMLEQTPLPERTPHCDPSIRERGQQERVEIEFWSVQLRGNCPQVRVTKK